MEQGKFTNEELLNLSIDWFNKIQEMSKKLNTGNVSHDSKSIQGFAFRCEEFLKKWKKDEKN